MKDFKGNWGSDSSKTNIDPDPIDVADGKYAAGSSNGPTGVCYASKICGKISGVAKQATIIPVARPYFGPQWLAAILEKILGELGVRRQKSPPQCLPGKTVVLLLFDYDLTDKQYELGRKQQAEVEELIENAIKALMNQGVIVITLAGDQKAGRSLTQAASNYVPQSVFSQQRPILRVGSVDSNGRISPLSKKGDVYMVGQDFFCADVNFLPFTPANKYMTVDFGTAGGKFFLY